MLTTIVTVLAVLWLLAMVTSYTMGGYIHTLLVVAVAILLVKMFRDRRPVAG